MIDFCVFVFRKKKAFSAYGSVVDVRIPISFFLKTICGYSLRWGS